jgi:hypothetical protein
VADHNAAIDGVEMRTFGENQVRDAGRSEDLLAAARVSRSTPGRCQPCTARFGWLTASS